MSNCNRNQALLKTNVCKKAQFLKIFVQRTRLHIHSVRVFLNFLKHEADLQHHLKKIIFCKINMQVASCLEYRRCNLRSLLWQTPAALPMYTHPLTTYILLLVEGIKSKRPMTFFLRLICPSPNYRNTFFFSLLDLFFSMSACQLTWEGGGAKIRRQQRTWSSFNMCPCRCCCLLSVVFIHFFRLHATFPLTGRVPKIFSSGFLIKQLSASKPWCGAINSL